MNWEIAKNKLIDFLNKELEKSKQKGLIVGLSGGLDSAIVAVLCKEAVKENLKCVIMPTHYSSDQSLKDALSLCKKFDLSYEIVDIAPLLKPYEQSMQNDKLRIGNFSARLRMAVLFDLSAKYHSLVVGTSNKSEIMLGYSTIYGDSAYAINPIGELYKSDLFDFAKALGINDEIISKAPSGDLWQGQSDEEDLGYSYQELDIVIKELFDKKRSKEELYNDGFSQKIVEFVLLRYNNTIFKRTLPKIAIV